MIMIMAKWGEGDPRWIVEERPDATNINNWHWTENKADAWSKAKFKVSLMIRSKDVLRLIQNFSWTSSTTWRSSF